MELTKDFNEIYKSLGNFWDSIYPILLFNILFLFLFSWIIGVRLLSWTKIENLLSSERLSGFKRMILKVKLHEKINWAFIGIAFLIYLVIFNGLFKIFASINIPLASIRHSNEAFYAEAKPIEKMTLIAKLSPVEKPSLLDVDETKDIILADYSGKNEGAFENRVTRNRNDLASDLTIYKLSVLSFLLAVLLMTKLKIERSKKWKTLGRYFLFLLINLIVILNLRWWVEQDYEAVFVGEIKAASSYIEKGEYRATRGHSYEGRPDSSLNSLYNHLLTLCNDYPGNAPLWISKCKLISGYFGGRKLWELKEHHSQNPFPK